MKAYASLVRHPAAAASSHSRGPIRVSKRPTTLGGKPPKDQGLTVLSEWESKQRLTGLPLVPERRTTSLAEAAVAVSELRAPLVAKASGVAHKSELGLVILGLSPEEVLDTWQELADAGDGTVLVAEFIQGELELVVGGLRDPHFGPAVTLGLGGVAAEVFNDTVTVLAPPDPGEVESAVKALRGAPLLHGYRGTEPMDFRTLEMIARTVADALTDHDDIIEIDCNPVVITRGKPVVVDALVVVCN